MANGKRRRKAKWWSFLVLFGGAAFLPLLSGDAALGSAAFSIHLWDCCWFSFLGGAAFLLHFEKREVPWSRKRTTSTTQKGRGEWKGSTITTQNKEEGNPQHQYFLEVNERQNMGTSTDNRVGPDLTQFGSICSWWLCVFLNLIIFSQTIAWHEETAPPKRREGGFIANYLISPSLKLLCLFWSLIKLFLTRLNWIDCVLCHTFFSGCAPHQGCGGRQHHPRAEGGESSTTQTERWTVAPPIDWSPGQNNMTPEREVRHLCVVRNFWEPPWVHEKDLQEKARNAGPPAPPSRLFRGLEKRISTSKMRIYKQVSFNFLYTLFRFLGSFLTCLFCPPFFIMFFYGRRGLSLGEQCVSSLRRVRSYLRQTHTSLRPFLLRLSTTFVRNFVNLSD